MNYEQLLDIANQRITCTSDILPQNAFDIALQLNVRLKNHIECKHDFKGKTYPLQNTDAILAINNGEYTIYYDENNPYSNFAIAHEIAHYLLGHTSDGAEEHRNAQLMAAILIAPPHKISFKDIKSSAELSVKYKIPTDAAGIYWYEICNHRHKTPLITPKIVLPLGVVALLAISIISTYFIGVSSVIRGGVNRPTEASSEQQYVIHTVQATPAPEISVSESISTVYVTPSGKKYHKSTCRHIKKSTLMEFSIEDAINAGYEPCKDCMQ